MCSTLHMFRTVFTAAVRTKTSQYCGMSTHLQLQPGTFCLLYSPQAVYCVQGKKRDQSFEHNEVIPVKAGHQSISGQTITLSHIYTIRNIGN